MRVTGLGEETTNAEFVKFSSNFTKEIIFLYSYETYFSMKINFKMITRQLHIKMLLEYLLQSTRSGKIKLNPFNSLNSFMFGWIINPLIY